MSSPVSRGFRHLHRSSVGQEGRVPPGQYVTEGFPVLSAGPTPHTPLQEWTFSIRQGGDTLRSWTWEEFQALSAETVKADIHCVTRWSKLDTGWRGVSVDTLWTRCPMTRPTCWRFATAAIPRTCRSRTSPAARRGWPSATTASRCKPSTAARLACWCRTCTSGRARNGYGAWSCAIATNPGSGRATATTSTETHGESSGTRATDLAGRPGELGDQGNGFGLHDRAGGA